MNLNLTQIGSELPDDGGMFLADLHVHSTFSDGKLSIPELVDFYGSRGFGAIAVTDHICEASSLIGFTAHHLRYTLTPETFSHYIEILNAEKERAWDQYRMVLIPGFELSKNTWSNQRSAHILGLGVSRFVNCEGDVLEMARAIRAQGAVAVAAHPVSTGKFEKQTLHLWNRREELASEFDAWEVASGPTWFKAVEQSGLPMLASSDLHHPRQLSAWKTLFTCERHEAAILRAIRRQDLTFRFYQENAKSALSFALPFPKWA